MINSDEKIKIAAIVGPTACGKTALSVEVAKELDGEIICCDSMQVYKEMYIGTAAPTADEMREIPHHLFASVEPQRTFSCSDYAAAADVSIKEIASRGKLPILVGGTGLYLDSVLLGCGDSSAAPDEAFRSEMKKIAEEQGNAALHALLSEKDPEAASAIHPNNVKRVIRALEICNSCGSKTEYDRRARSGMRYDASVVGVNYADRSALYDRINRRIDKMIDMGLVAETEKLLSLGTFDTNSTAAQAIGYKEILPYIRGDEELPLALERLKTATRHYAKRQLTWFSAKEYVKWIYADGIENEKTFKNIVKNIVKTI